MKETTIHIFFQIEGTQALQLHLSSLEEEPTLTLVLYGMEDVTTGSPEDEDDDEDISIIAHEAGIKLEAGVLSWDQAVGEADDADVPNRSLEPIVLVEEEPDAKDDDDDADIIFVEQQVGQMFVSIIKHLILCCGQYL